MVGTSGKPSIRFGAATASAGLTAVDLAGHRSGIGDGRGLLARDHRGDGIVGTLVGDFLHRHAGLLPEQLGRKLERGGGTGTIRFVRIRFCIARYHPNSVGWDRMTLTDA
jgi:hypothetical protein